MKSKTNYILGALLSLCLSACVLDNYDGPNAQLYGSVIDEKTGQPIQQDIYEGSRIEYLEQSLKTPTTAPLQIRFHSDGTYNTNNLFSGKYEIQAVRGNFFPTEKEMIEINGKTEHVFRSSPYIRIENVNMAFDEISGKVTAEFTLNQLSDNPVESVSLMADRNINVSNSVRSATASKVVNAVVSPTQKFKVSVSTENLISGKDYYFRVAALISGIPEAKHNYSAPVKLAIDNSHVIPDLPIPGKVWDACESTAGWESDLAISLDTGDKKEGNACVKFEGNSGIIMFMKAFDTPFDTEVTREDGYMAFDLFVNDATYIPDLGGGQTTIELTSGGRPDVEEVFWTTSQMNLLNGWNRVELKLSDGVFNGGNLKLNAVNFIRFYNLNLAGNVVLKIDHIRFYSK